MSGPSSSSNSNISNDESTSKSQPDSPPQQVERPSRSPARRKPPVEKSAEECAVVVAHKHSTESTSNKLSDRVKETSGNTADYSNFNQRKWRENDMRSCRPRANTEDVLKARIRESQSLSPEHRKVTRPRSLSFDQRDDIFLQQNNIDPDRLNKNMVRKRAIRNRSPSKPNDIRNNNLRAAKNCNLTNSSETDVDNKTTDKVDDLLIVNNLNNLTTQAFGDMTLKPIKRKTKNLDNTLMCKSQDSENSADTQSTEQSGTVTGTDEQIGTNIYGTDTSSVSYPSDLSCTNSIPKGIYRSLSSSSSDLSQHEKELTVQTDEAMSSNSTARDIIIHQPPVSTVDTDTNGTFTDHSAIRKSSQDRGNKAPCPRPVSKPLKRSPDEDMVKRHEQLQRRNSPRCNDINRDTFKAITKCRNVVTDQQVNKGRNERFPRSLKGKVGNDGRLGSYASERAVPVAVQGNIKIVDQIHTWDCQLSADSTFDKNHQLIAKSNHDIMHNLRHPNETGVVSEPTSARHSGSSQESTPKSEGGRRRRRKLPKTPHELKSCSTHVAGNVQLQLWFNDEAATLTVTAIQAQGLQARSTGENSVLPNPYVKIYLLPQRSANDCFKSQTQFMNSEPVWDHTHVFSNVTEDEFYSHSLEITIWDYYPHRENAFLGEVHLKLCDANVLDVPKWYTLQVHDEKSSASVTQILSLASLNLKNKCVNNIAEQELPKPYSGSKSANNSPAHKDANQMKRYRSLNVDQDQEQLIEGKLERKLSADVLVESTDKGRGRESRTSFRFKKMRWKHVSNALYKAFDGKIGGSVDSHTKPLGLEEKNGDPVKKPASLQNSPVPVKKSHFDFVATPSKNACTSSKSTDSAFTDDEVETINSGTEKNADDSSTATLRTGQISPTFADTRQGSRGDIKLSLLIIKGHLEIEILCARNLNPSSGINPPDSYVKTYLTDGRKRYLKRKTKTVRGTCDPQFQQKLKYSASDIFRRQVETSVWEKSSVLNKNRCIGTVIINLEDLDLNVQKTSWYTLSEHPNGEEFGSTDSLDY
ncbi:uncharacterized protein LOC141899072 [Tubulanus polymorphus]|uniref:uncharacterized protein LOC141899072 n=1 Tax=Tubulanus polymorphus TaxID=672921 RepID=UPI003DA4C4FA